LGLPKGRNEYEVVRREGTCVKKGGSRKERAQRRVLERKT